MVKLDKECRQNPEEKTVVDERCFCRHLKSEHGPRIRSSGHIERIPGPCKVKGCKCSRFIWFGWVFEDGSET